MQYTNKVKKGTAGRLLKYIIKHYKLRLLIVFLCLAVGAIASVTATIFLQRLIDECITPGITNGMASVWKQLITFVIIMASVYALGVLASFLYTQIMAKVTQGTLTDLRKDMYKKMETLPIKYFDTHAHGDIMSTYTNDTDAIRQLIDQSIPTIIQSVMSIVSVFVMMLCYSLWLTIVVVAFMILMFFVTAKVGGASSRFMVAQQRSLGKEEGFIEEMMNGQKVIKVFCHESDSKKDFANLNETLFKDSETANKYGNILMPVLGNIGNLLYVVLAIVGGALVFSNAFNLGFMGYGTITIGILISFLGMSRQLSQTVAQISTQVAMVAMGIAGAGRVFELLDEESEYDDGYVSLVKVYNDGQGNYTETENSDGIWAWKHPHRSFDAITYTPVMGSVVMDDVDFAYSGDKYVLHNVSLYAKPGQKIAFVGATGAGKTTITNLINRFYDIADGKIRYDGININKIKKPDLRKSMGIILQDVNLFTDTVINNIRYGRLEATDEECIEAAKLANADDFITRLPEGYSTMLTNNGSNLSQGQRQLISIARAAVADAPVMIMDEATSSIDTHTEALVQSGMDKLMKGRTVFVIAHRLSTVHNSDAIMVLDHGRIIERGSHEQLVENKGTYYQLYTGAFELD